MPNENEDGSQNPSAEPKYVTAEEIGNIVNAAVSSHLRRSLGPSIEAALKPALEQIKAAVPAPAPVTEDGEGTKKGKQSPETLALAKKLEDMEKALKDERDRTAAAEKKARDQRARGDLRTALEGKVRPELLDTVTSLLFQVDNRVDFDESGNILFKASRATYPGSSEYEDVLLPLKSGVEEYLKGDAAKAFLPAPSAGAGSSPLPKRGPTPPAAFNPSTTGNSEAERIQRSMERERLAEQRLGKQ